MLPSLGLRLYNINILGAIQENAYDKNHMGKIALPKESMR
jgi:hypothetical protein